MGTSDYSFLLHISPTMTFQFGHIFGQPEFPAPRNYLAPRVLAALDTAACAAFLKESRMEPANVDNTNRKSGPAA